MRIRNRVAGAMFALLAGTLSITACEEHSSPLEVTDDPDFRLAYAFRSSVQVDRFGLPAVNTVFIPSSLKDAFNAAHPQNDERDFADVIVNTLMSLGVGEDLAGVIADFVTPDIQPIDTSVPSGFPNGRRPQDDVITAELMLIFGSNAALNDDHVDANDVPFLAEFPYLGQPHAP